MEGREIPVTEHQPVRVPSSFQANVQLKMLVDVNKVHQVSVNMEPSASPAGLTPVLIDSRARERFLGLEETLDNKAGHIPGAFNFFWKETQNADGSYKSAEELQEHFSELDKDAEIIVYCGSGVTACPNVLALERAGFNNVRLYPGSWSDWISYQENAVATGEE